MVKSPFRELTRQNERENTDERLGMREGRGGNDHSHPLLKPRMNADPFIRGSLFSARRADHFQPD
jgi:hypothetical protein